MNSDGRYFIDGMILIMNKQVPTEMKSGESTISYCQSLVFFMKAFVDLPQLFGSSVRS